MRYGEDPQMVQMAALLAEAIGQSVVRQIGVSLDCEVTTNQDGYIIAFTGELPEPPGLKDPLGPQRWAAEVRGEFETLVNASAGMTAETIVGNSAAEIVALWRRDTSPAQTGAET